MLNKEAQLHLIRHRLLDPPADGEWGPLSFRALQNFQKLAGLEPDGKLDDKTKQALQQKEIIPLSLGNDFASNIIRYCLANDYWIPVGPEAFTIVYVEGVDRDGNPNGDTHNQWNDRRIVIEIPDGKPVIIGNWNATSEPGTYYTHNRMNPRGVARIKFGQYRAWCIGLHGSNPYEALEQCREILVYRDDNEDYVRTGDKIYNNASAVNQHHGWDAASVDANSAGCLVGQSIAGHRDFMDLVKTDRRYTANNNYIFYTAVIPGNELK